MVDTGAIDFVAMPKRLIEQLGLTQFGTGRAGQPGGCRHSGSTVGPANNPGSLLFGRSDGGHDECPILIGYAPLELLDFACESERSVLDL